MDVRPLEMAWSKEGQQRVLVESLVGPSSPSKLPADGASSSCAIAIFSAACGVMLTLASLVVITTMHNFYAHHNPPLEPFLHPLSNHNHSSASDNPLAVLSDLPTMCDSSTCHKICASLALAQEVGTRRNWLPPPFCERYLENYIQSQQYKSDFDTSVYFIEKALQSLPVTGDGSDMVVLDIDETSLSNAPYYEENHYGVVPFNATKWNQWVLKAEAQPFDAMVKMCTRLLSSNWSIAFITGRDESQRDPTVLNLHKAGYHNWTTLFLRSEDQLKLPAVEYKSQCRSKLEMAGYTIWGNIGDQWTDLEGRSIGNRTFKLPNPFYFVG